MTGKGHLYGEGREGEVDAEIGGNNTRQRILKSTFFQDPSLRSTGPKTGDMDDTSCARLGARRRTITDFFSNKWRPRSIYCKVR